MRDETAMLESAADLAMVHSYRTGKVFSPEEFQAIGHNIRLDPHQASARPCSTCRRIVAILGEPFWCIALAIEEEKKRKK